MLRDNTNILINETTEINAAQNIKGENVSSFARKALTFVVAFGFWQKGKIQKITIEFLTVDLRQKWLKEWNMCTIVMASLSGLLSNINGTYSIPYWTNKWNNWCTDFISQELCHLNSLLPNLDVRFVQSQFCWDINYLIAAHDLITFVVFPFIR